MAVAVTVGVADEAAVVFVGVAEAAAVVEVGVADAAVVVFVAEAAAVVEVAVGTVPPEARKMCGPTHKARSPVAVPAARTVRMNLTSLPASGLRSTSIE